MEILFLACFIFPAIIFFIGFAVGRGIRTKATKVNSKDSDGKVSNIDSSLVKKSEVVAWIEEYKTNGKLKDENIDQILNDFNSEFKEISSSNNNLHQGLAPLSSSGLVGVVNDTSIPTSLDDSTSSDLYVSSSRNDVTSTINPKKKYDGISGGEIAIYLGLLFIFFSVIVLVSFAWEGFTRELKVLFITAMMGGLYATGFILRNKNNFHNVGVVFLIISSLLFGLWGGGIWNFYISSYVKISFEAYWFLFSFFWIANNFIVLKLSGVESIANIYILSIYSLLLSFSLILTETAELRVIYFAILNFAVYLTTSLTGYYKMNFTIFSVLLNVLLDLQIIFIILGEAENGTSVSALIKTSAFFALAIPSLFYASTYYIDKRLEFLNFVLVENIMKILIFCTIFFQDYQTWLFTVTTLYVLVIDVIWGLRNFPKETDLSVKISNLLGIFVVYVVSGYLWTQSSPSNLLSVETMALFSMIGVSLFSLLRAKVLFSLFIILSLYPIYRIFYMVFGVEDLVLYIVLGFVINLIFIGVKGFFDKTNSGKIFPLYLLNLVISSFIALPFSYKPEETLVITLITLYGTQSLLLSYADRASGLYIIYGVFLYVIAILLNFYEASLFGIYVSLVVFIISTSISTFFAMKEIELPNWLSTIKKINIINLVANIVLLLTVLSSQLNNYWTDDRVSLSLLYILISIPIGFSRSRSFRGFLGVPIVLSVWNLVELNSLNFQLYVIPLVIYLLLLGVYSSVIMKNKTSGFNFYDLGVAIQLFSLVGQASVVDNKLEAFGYLILSVIIASSLVIYGFVNSGSSPLLRYISFFALFIAFNVFIFIILEGIPYWLYLTLFGLILIGSGIFAVSRYSKKT